MDDIVTESNSRTKNGVQQVKDWYRNSQALKTGRMETEWKTAPVHHKVVGTRWSFDDAYGDLLEQKALPVYLRRAVENGEPIYPTAFTLESLAEIRRDMGSTSYSYQYDMNPIDDATARFKHEQSPVGVRRRRGRARLRYHDKGRNGRLPPQGA